MGLSLTMRGAPHSGSAQGWGAISSPHLTVGLSCHWRPRPCTCPAPPSTSFGVGQTAHCLRHRVGTGRSWGCVIPLCGITEAGMMETVPPSR